MRMMISQSHPQAGLQRAPSSRPLLLLLALCFKHLGWEAESTRGGGGGEELSEGGTGGGGEELSEGGTGGGGEELSAGGCCMTLSRRRCCG